MTTTGVDREQRGWAAARARCIRVTWIGSVALLCAMASTAQERLLRVCADPNNLPFSNERLEGFENKLAQIVADELHARVQYTWRPERRGFIRRGLKAGECDVVMGVPSGLEMVLSTTPYFRSTYVFVYPKDSRVQVQSFDDPALRTLTIGVHLFGEDGANAPPAHALARRGIVTNVVGFPMWAADAIESPSGTIIDAVGTGRIDLAIVWGPFGGYFSKRQAAALAVVPVSPAVDGALPFIFDIAMGVRPGETAFKQELDDILNRRRADIRQLLDDYGVPIVSAKESRR
jgi:quinoprotein dehydrogenase-associated probable ABC transporter substrate-binding protein